MKSFKDFILEKKKSWLDSSLSFNSSFNEMRSNKKLNEELNWITRKDDEPYEEKQNRFNVKYNAAIHDHNDYHSNKLTPEEQKYIHSYTSAASDSLNGYGSSKNMNGMLRNMAGDKNSKILHQKTQDILESIKKMSSCFRPETTNRKEIITWGGIPEHISNHLLNLGKDSDHHLPGFTSTSTDRSTAIYFAGKYNNAKDYSEFKSTPLHVIQYHVKPGAGLSVAAHSPHNENELILHHGAKITYHGHKRISLNNGQTVILHHVTVQPDHKSLEEYGQYDHPKD
jgi:hypothetical protein